MPTAAEQMVGAELAIDPRDASLLVVGNVETPSLSAMLARVSGAGARVFALPTPLASGLHRLSTARP